MKLHRFRQYLLIKPIIVHLLLFAICVPFFCSACQPTPVIQTNNVDNEKSVINSAKKESKHPTIRITTGEWEPYAGEQLPGFGCDSRVVREVFTLLDYRVEFGFFPWARAYELAKIGEWDGTVEWDDTPDHRKDFFINAEPISEQKWVFFYLKNSAFNWDSIEDLAGKTVGITSGYVYSDAFKEISKTDKTRFEEASSDQANFSKLLAGRIDVFPMEKNVGLALLKKYYSVEEQSRIIYHSKQLSTFNTYLLLTKKDPNNINLIHEFNGKLLELKNSPQYNFIMKDCPE